MSNIEDKEFEAYLKGDSELSQAYSQLEDEAVPDSLDNVILDASKPSGKRTQRSKLRLVSQSLDSPLAMAAVLVLCVSLVLVLSTHEQSFEDMPLHSPPVASSPSEVSEMPAGDVLEKEVQVTRSESAVARESSVNTGMDAVVNDGRRQIVTQAPAESDISSAIAVEEEAFTGLSEITEFAADVSEFKAKKQTVPLKIKEAVQQAVSKINALLNSHQKNEAQKAYIDFTQEFPNEVAADWFTEQQLILLESR